MWKVQCDLTGLSLIRPAGTFSRGEKGKRAHAALLNDSVNDSRLAAFGFTSQNLPT